MAGRTVVITGGSHGIGAAITRAFHQAGDYVVVAGRNDTGLCAELGERAKFVVADVRNVQALHSMAREASSRTGSIDVLINNAGMSAWRPLAEIDESFWTDMIDTNLKSVMFASQAVAAYAKPGSSIINVSSLAGKRGSANNSVYCAAKFGVNGITQSLAKELGRSGIRVNAVCPVYVRTEGLDVALKESQSPTGGNDIGNYLEQFAATQTALGTLPTDTQIASSCLFLASEAAGAITGQCINVDCGVLPQ